MHSDFYQIPNCFFSENWQAYLQENNIHVEIKKIRLTKTISKRAELKDLFFPISKLATKLQYSWMFATDIGTEMSTNEIELKVQKWSFTCIVNWLSVFPDNSMEEGIVCFLTRNGIGYPHAKEWIWILSSHHL